MNVYNIYQANKSIKYTTKQKLITLATNKIGKYKLFFPLMTFLSV